MTVLAALMTCKPDQHQRVICDLASDGQWLIFAFLIILFGIGLMVFALWVLAVTGGRK